MAVEAAPRQAQRQKRRGDPPQGGNGVGVRCAHDGLLCDGSCSSPSKTILRRRICRALDPKQLVSVTGRNKRDGSASARGIGDRAKSARGSNIVRFEAEPI